MLKHDTADTQHVTGCWALNRKEGLKEGEDLESEKFWAPFMEMNNPWSQACVWEAVLIIEAHSNSKTRSDTFI